MKHQTTTHMGMYSIFGGFLNAFENTKLENFGSALNDLTFGELFSIIIPFAIGLWAILHNEDKNDNIGTSRADTTYRKPGVASGSGTESDRQGIDGRSDKAFNRSPVKEL